MKEYIEDVICENCSSKDNCKNVSVSSKTMISEGKNKKNPLLTGSNKSKNFFKGNFLGKGSCQL